MHGGEGGRGLCSSRGRGWPCSRGSAETSGRRLPFFSPALMSVCLLRCGGYLMEKNCFFGTTVGAAGAAFLPLKCLRAGVSPLPGPPAAAGLGWIAKGWREGEPSSVPRCSIPAGNWAAHGHRERRGHGVRAGRASNHIPNPTSSMNPHPKYQTTRSEFQIPYFQAPQCASQIPYRTS